MASWAAGAAELSHSALGVAEGVVTAVVVLEEIGGVLQDGGGKGALWNVDLGLSVDKVDINHAIDGLAVSGWVEDVANNGAISEWLVGHLDVLLVGGVGQGNEELTTRVGVEVVIDISLNLLLVPDLGGLTLGVDGGDLLVEIGVGVVGLPEGLTVLWVSSASIVLLSTVVGEWDTAGGKGEGHSRLESSLVVGVSVQESWVVVVVNEDSEEVDILEVAVLSVVAVPEVIHGLATSEHITNAVVHWVVEESGEVVLVRRDVGWVSVEALSHLEDTGGLAILLPEVAWDLWNGVDSDTIEAVVADDTSDPLLEVVADEGVALIEVWQVSQSAVLNLGLVVPVLDLAVTVEVLGLVEWVELTVVSSDWASVVGDDVDHHPDALVVGSLDELLEVVLRTEVGVEVLPVTGPVSVVATIGVVHNWGDPDGIESHSLDVVELLDHTLVVSTTVVAEVGAGAGVAITAGEPISEDLVNRALFPLIRVSSGGGGCNKGSGKGELGEHSFEDCLKILFFTI